jgi:hypothetical protein
MNDFCVVYNHEACTLSVAKMSDVVELNNGCFLDDKPPLGIIRQHMEEEHARRFVRAFAPTLSWRQLKRQGASVPEGIDA